MSVLVTGECLGVTTENVPYEGSSFESTTIHVIEAGGVEVVKLQPVRDFPRDALPARGELVAFEVYPSARVSKSGNPYTLYKASRRIPALEAFLAQQGKPAPTAVKG